jgi:type IV pilus assembly protein PilW
MQGHDQRGFTLFELLVAAATFGLVIVGALTMFATASNSYRIGQTRAESHQNARSALELIARELRVAGYDLSDTISGLSSPTPIQVGATNSVSFVADVTEDGVLDRVTYRLQGAQVVRELSSWTGSDFSTPAVSEIADGVATLSFSYFDDATPNATISAPVASADLDDVRRVTVGIVTSESMADQQQDFPLTVDVRIRN